MTDFSALLAPDRGEPAISIVPVSRTGFDDWLTGQSEIARIAVAAARFKGAEDTAVFLPGNGPEWQLAVGLGDAAQPGRWTLAAAARALPPGHYRLATEAEADTPALHGWLMAQHHYERYRKQPDHDPGPRTLLVQNVEAMGTAIAEAEAGAIVRDLIDTPAEALGPAELETAMRTIADDIGGEVTAIAGEALAGQNFPAVHAVGRASPRQPRLLTLDWGNSAHPTVAIVGKGICFDTGGLNLKPGRSMGLMKKDMGGAAHALVLTQLVARANLPVRIRLIIAAADNAVSGNAIRPGDVIHTRKGTTVEISNTDAEGRLVLADALTLAGEADPALILNFATLTGAARVALGPDLPAMFANDDQLAAQLLAGSDDRQDPLWRLPLWQPYRRLFRSTIAGLDNSSDSGFAGAVVAALFLQHFIPEKTPWAHFDIYGWNPTARPGRPKGGAAMALFACMHMLEQRFA